VKSTERGCVGTRERGNETASHVQIKRKKKKEKERERKKEKKKIAT
jgi:hypothetical protein